VRQPAFYIAALVGALATGVLLVVLSLQKPASAQVQNQLHFDCQRFDTKVADPIRPEANHLHDLLGNTSLSDTSTYESLVAHTETSCELPFATSAYWTPQIYLAGQPLSSYKAAIYYHAAKPDSVSHIPDGLQMLAVHQPGDVDDEVTFKCGKDPTTAFSEPYYGCKENFRIVYHFPECWNGDSLGVSSLTDSVGTTCPSGSVRVVSLRLSFHYRHPNPGSRLPSPLEFAVGDHEEGGWSAAHADAFEANQQPEFNDTIEMCVMNQIADPICSRGT
jgi:hypothetical protein